VSSTLSGRTTSSPRFDAGVAEQILDQPEEVVAGRVHPGEMLSLQRADRPSHLLGQQRGVADDRIDGCAELVTDRREELRLGGVRLLGGLARLELGRLQVRPHDRLRAHHAQRAHERALVLVEVVRVAPRESEDAAQLAVRPDGHDGRGARALAPIMSLAHAG
jgi:hypothetical protein